MEANKYMIKCSWRKALSAKTYFLLLRGDRDRDPDKLLEEEEEVEETDRERFRRFFELSDRMPNGNHTANIPSMPTPFKQTNKQTKNSALTHKSNQV
jgi:hypothetical protein